MQKFGRLGVFLLLILLFVFQLTSVGQNKKNFVVTGKIDPEVTTAKSGLIEVSKTGGAKTNVEVPKNGRFRLELEYFSEFTLTFTYPGNFSKTIVISTDIPQDVWERDNDFPPYPMVVKLLREVEGIDRSFTLKPSGKVFYSKQTDNFESEIIVNDAQIAQQVNNAQKQSGEVRKEEKTISKTEAQDLAAKQKSYDQTIHEADNLFKKGEYLNAMLKYQDAKKLFPEKPYANDRIAEIQELVKVLDNTEKQKAEQEKKYKELIARANASFEKKALSEARSSYEEALQLLPADAYATGRIQEIDRLIALQGKQKQFDELVAQADKSYQSKQLDQALTLYTQAQPLVPENDYPQKQINLINQEKEKLAKADQQQKDYQALIAKADQSFNRKDYAVAQGDYSKAVALMPAETYPANRIKEIEQILKKEQEARLAEENYQSVIAKADKLFNSKSFDEAKKVYGDALALKPGEVYPTEQISKIGGLMAEKARQQQTEAEFIALAAKGDEAFGQKEYETAKTRYTSALEIKPTSAEVIAKIKNIDSILQKIAADKKKEEERLLALAKDKEKAYNAAITVADKNVTDKRYPEAKAKYEEALQYMPDAGYPKQQIERLDALLAQARAERQTEEQYASAMKDANALFSNKDYPGARLSYVKASEIKPSEQLPGQRIKEIDKILSDLALEEARNKTLEASYQEKIQRADQQLAAKEYTEARVTYGEASAVKPAEEYPKTRIAEIDKLMADLQLQKYNEAIAAGDRAFTSDQLDEATTHYELALTTKAGDPYAKKQLAEITKRRTALQAERERLRKLDEQYAALMADAEKIFNSKEYEKAKGKYQEAMAVKPQETLPKEQIEKINDLLNELRNVEETNRLYAENMKTAENAFRQNKLKEARDAYQKAHDVKPAEPVPTQKIAELNAMMAQLEETARLAAQQEADRQAKEKADREQYKKAIAQGDQAFGEKQYPEARTHYTDALNVYASEKYPKDQITKIDALIAQQEEEAKKAALLAQAKEPVVQAEQLPAPVASSVESAQTTEARAQSYRTINNYDEAITKADDAFGIKDYTVARFFYYKASDLKPNEEYPKNQIELIRKLVDSELSAVDRTGYDKVIAQADDAFLKKNYTGAKFYYYKALEIKSWEKYPKDRIHEILVLTNSLLSEKEEKEYSELIAKADEALVGKDVAIARFYYNKAISMKKDEEYPKIKLKDIQKMMDQDKLDQQNNEYNKLIELGDQALESGNYSIARFNYNKAISMRPNEKYPKDQMKKLREALEKQNK